MRDTRNNLILFLLANNGLTSDNNVIAYTSMGVALLKPLAERKSRKIAKINSRFYRDRHEMYLKLVEKKPELKEFCDGLGLEL